MPHLSSNPLLGSSSTSSLLRSANSLQSSVQAYQDSLQAFEYSNSAYTDEAFQGYQKYLGDRITTLSSAGGITNAQKALTLTRTLEAATKSNISASISRENIQIMGGDGTLQDKLSLIGTQFTRAMSIGDNTLAQQLEGQYYSVSQQIQYQAQQAASAADTLAKAGVSNEGQIADNVKKSISYFEGIAKNGSEKELNATLKDFVKTNGDTFKALGVKIDSQQPNYFDVVTALVGAAYNHTVLKAQAEAPINPILSKNYAIDAANMLNGNTKFDTLAGSKTFSEIQSFSQDPNALAFDSATGKYKVTTQTGYQYENQITGYDNSGNEVTGKVLVPTYSGIVGGTNASKVYFLSPNETKVVTKLGLNFTQSDVSKEVAAGHQVGSGVEVQLTKNSPDWLKNVLGKNGVTKIFSDQNGDIQFQGAASGGKGSSYYTLVNDGKGLNGLYEHTVDGKTRVVGGDYGFNQGAAALLINQSQTVQRNISLQTQFQQMDLKLHAPQPLPNISIAPAASTPQIQQSHAAPNIKPPSSVAPQTINPQTPGNVTYGPNIKVQGGSANLLYSGGGTGIHL